MINNTGFNFANIQDIINAAENLQRAGKDADCKRILVDLAKDLLEDAQKYEQDQNNRC